MRNNNIKNFRIQRGFFFYFMPGYGRLYWVQVSPTKLGQRRHRQCKANHEKKKTNSLLFAIDLKNKGECLFFTR